MKKYGKRRYKKKTYRKRKTSFKRRTKRNYDQSYKVKFTAVQNVQTANTAPTQSTPVYWWWGANVAGALNNISYG